MTKYVTLVMDSNYHLRYNILKTINIRIYIPIVFKYILGECYYGS